MPNQFTPKRVPIVPIGPSIAYIPLTQGKYALIDLEDLSAIQPYQWYATLKGRNYYAVRNLTSGCKFTEYLHQRITRGLNWEIADHKNAEYSLDNRRANLRSSTVAGNLANSKISKRNKSGFKGVNFHKASGKWRASIGCKNRAIHIGLYDSPEHASTAYAKAAISMHGEFARTQ
jgi:hypothetical protein